MRTILGRYLELPASRVPFREGEFGKPLLAGPLSRDDLRFNLSHSGQLALLAVTSGREVGVDIELMRPEMLEDTIPEQFFSPYEVSTLRALPEADQLQAFFNCWTRKEAYIKALGVGLQMPLDSFDVTLTPGAPAILLGTRPDTGQTRRWSMHALSPDPAYAGALVVEGPISRLLCWEWAT